jgi:hypothetical protein
VAGEAEDREVAGEEEDREVAGEEEDPGEAAAAERIEDKQEEVRSVDGMQSPLDWPFAVAYEDIDPPASNQPVYPCPQVCSSMRPPLAGSS